MDRNALEESVRSSAGFEFSKSGGPGGQNTNKVNSRVTVRIPFQAIQGLSMREREQAAARLAARVTSGGEILVTADDERDQIRNRELALRRLILLIERAATLLKPRVPTVATRASRERRLESKRQRSDTKRGRSERGFES